MAPVIRLIFAAILLLSISAPSAAAGHFQSKVEQLDLGILDTGRPSKIMIWYPQGECPSHTSKLCLTKEAVTSKVVVFSHGAMGSAGNYSWLGEGLATAGFIVVGVNHFGESAVYEKGTQNPRTGALIWQRAQDVSALLTKLDGAKLFQREVNWNNVVAMGHSAGGQTAALLAGARFDLRRLAPYCASDSAKEDLSCNYSRNSENAPERFVAMFNASYQDGRVKAIVLLDPAQGSALQPESAASVAVPSLVIGSFHNDFLPWRNHGERYAASLPKAQIILLGGQEGHFVFLTPCQHDTQVMGVSLCNDRPGVDRVAVQRDLVKGIVEFVQLDNESASMAAQPAAPPKTNARFMHDNSLFQTLLYTPSWVFALLGGLCVVGLLQARTRPVPLWLALVLPAGMLVLSLSGVVQYVGLWLPALLAWVIGVVASTWLLLRGKGHGTARYEPASGKYIVRGSWVPLLVILGIFSVRYAMGVARAMEIEVVRDHNLQLAVSLLLGALSGFFLSRGLLIWRLRAACSDEQLSAS